MGGVGGPRGDEGISGDADDAAGGARHAGAVRMYCGGCDVAREEAINYV